MPSQLKAAQLMTEKAMRRIYRDIQHLWDTDPQPGVIWLRWHVVLKQGNLPTKPQWLYEAIRGFLGVFKRNAW